MKLGAAHAASDWLDPQYMKKGKEAGAGDDLAPNLAART
jgi:hypothetical protein